MHAAWERGGLILNQDAMSPTVYAIVCAMTVIYTAINVSVVQWIMVGKRVLNVQYVQVTVIGASMSATHIISKTYEETEERTQEDLCQAVAGKTQVEAMIHNMEARLAELDENVMKKFK